jgi:hypothetical protein
VVPVANCCPVRVNAVTPPQDTVTKGRKKHRVLPTNRSKEAIDFRFAILVSFFSATLPRVDIVRHFLQTDQTQLWIVVRDDG